MPEISDKISESLSEYVILPGETHEGIKREEISLATKIGDVNLELPFLSAAMSSVTGKALALELARIGGLPVVPYHGVSIEEQCAIVQAVHGDRMRFIEDPTSVREDTRVVDVLEQAATYGHSNVFVTNQFRRLMGILDINELTKSDRRVTRDTLVKEVMRCFGKEDNSIPYHIGEIEVKAVEKIFEERKEIGYLVLVNDQDALLKVAFKKDMKEKKVAGAIGTKGDWKERARTLADAGVNVIVMDTSEAHGYWAHDLIREYKKDSELKDIPLIAGNVVTAEAFHYLAEAGADAVKAGMGIGSICTTTVVKGMGRGQFTVARELSEARDVYKSGTGKYIPIILDGGMKSTANIAVALSMADAVMLGRMFNQFYEAAGENLNGEEKRARDGEPIKWKRTWGEGSKRAANLMRYDIPELRAFYEQGVEGIVPYEGRLKPRVEQWVRIIGDVLFGSGVNKLEDYRRLARLEKMSLAAQHDAGATVTVRN